MRVRTSGVIVSSRSEAAREALGEASVEEWERFRLVLIRVPCELLCMYVYCAAVCACVRVRSLPLVRANVYEKKVVKTGLEKGALCVRSDDRP